MDGAVGFINENRLAVDHLEHDFVDVHRVRVGNFAYDFPNTDIQVGVAAYLGLSQWGRARLEANAKISREVLKDFYVGVKGYESYDSEPATEGAQRNDWGLTLTLGWRF